MIWDLWKKSFAVWEKATAELMEKTMQNPAVLGPAGTMLTAAMKTKTASDRAMSAWWAMWGLPTRRDQERSLHKLGQLETRLYDLEERLQDAEARATRPSGPSGPGGPGGPTGGGSRP